MTQILVGKLTKPHGLKGEMKLCSFSAGNIFDYPEFFDQKGNQIPLRLVANLQKDALYIVAISGVKSINEAEKYKGVELYVHRQPLGEDEFYYSDLVGRSVYDEHDVFIGVVDAIQDFGASPFITIKQESGKFSHAFFHKESILKIEDDRVVIYREFIV